jgi:integrase
MITWTAGELGSFLARAEADGHRDAALWRFLAATGCRRGEALGLRWRDVDLTARTATIRQTVIVVAHVPQFGSPKTAAGARTLDLDAATVTALREHRKRQAAERLQIGIGWRDNDLVFADVAGGPAHPEAASSRFAKRVKRHGLPRLTLHGLRHTWATLALRAGVHPKVVQERLGHATISITLGVYSHVQAGMGREAAELVAGLIDAP